MGKPSVVLRLGGGLGNQLFMYAFGLAMAERNRVPLELDVSGFLRDRTYKRRFLLDYVFTGLCRASRWDSRMFPLGHTLRKIERKLNAHRPMNQRRFVQERNLGFDPEIRNFKVAGKTVFNGYWQAPEYFDDLIPPIENRVAFAEELTAQVQGEADVIRSANAVCLAIRRYEEVPKPGIHILDADYYSLAMKRLEERVENPHYFVFAQDMEWARRNISSPHQITFANRKNADEGVIQDLYLMTLCRHFVISNSSLHWWAARLGGSAENSVVVAPKSGWPNPNALLKQWLTIDV